MKPAKAEVGFEPTNNGFGNDDNSIADAAGGAKDWNSDYGEGRATGLIQVELARGLMPQPISAVGVGVTKYATGQA